MTPDQLAELVSKMIEGPWVQIAGKYMSVDRGETPQVFRAIYEDDERGIMALRNLAPVLIAAWRLAEVSANFQQAEPDDREAGKDLLPALTAYRAAVAAQEGK